MSNKLAEALRDLIACKELHDAMVTTRSDPYYITQADHLEAQLERREGPAWDAARAALAEHDAQQDSNCPTTSESGEPKYKADRTAEDRATNPGSARQ